MHKVVTALLISSTIATQTIPAGAQPSARAGEGIAPAAAGQPCTAPRALRGSTVPAPKSGDVATAAQLCAGGVSAASLPHAPSIIPPATTVTSGELDQNQSLPPLVALGAPESTGVDIRTVNGNWTHLFSGAFWHAPAITPHGELQAIDMGHAQFSVAAALGYFAVVMPRFLARVKGTIFDVDYEPGQYVSFSVSEGSVSIVRLTAVHLDAENRDVDGIRQTDTITAAGTNTIKYDLPLKITQHFSNSQAAQQAFNAELQAATADGDPQAIDDELNNIQLITGKPIAAAGGHINGNTGSGGPGAGASAGSAASLSYLPVLAIAAAAATVGIVTSNQKPSATAAPTPNGTPTGSLTLTSIGRVKATPAPAPAALPAPTPSPAPEKGARPH